MLGMAGLTWFLLRRVRCLGKDVSVDEHGGQWTGSYKGTLSKMSEF